MTTQWERYSERLALEHRTSWEFPIATFYNYSEGTYDPDEGEMTGQTRSSIGEYDVELLPPQADSSVDEAGTSLSFDTSIRFPIEDGGLADQLVPLGEDSEKPTEVEVEGRDGTQTYELHTYSKEYADQMLMCRLVEK